MEIVRSWGSRATLEGRPMEASRRRGGMFMGARELFIRGNDYDRWVFPGQRRG